MEIKTKKILIGAVPVAVVICAIIALSGCQKGEKADKDAGVGTGTENSSDSMKPISVNLIVKDSDQSGGTASITEENGKVKVELKASGENVKGVRPAHIHSGSCGNTGWIKHVLSYPNDGNSVTVIDISPQEFMKNMPLALVIKESEKKDSKVISCGEVK